MQGPIVYTIGLTFDGESGRGEVHHARHDLEILSRETGGIAFFPKSLEDIDRIAAEVARDIRNQFTLAYHSTHPLSTGYHTISVKAHHPGGGKLIIHTRSGYLSRDASQNKVGPGER